MIKSKFRLVLADSDELYIDCLGKFIRNSFASRFDVSIFTTRDALCEFLMNAKEKADIVLSGFELAAEDICRLNAGMVILLVAALTEEQTNAFPGIYRYRTGEEILNRALELYSCVDSRIDSMLKGKSSTRTITVFSPGGGSGKSVICANLATQLMAAGLKVFYLNIETLSSSLLVSGLENTECGMSNILYYLKQNSGVMAVRINSSKSQNSRTGVSYFKPPDFAVEMDDMGEEELRRLLLELKRTAWFDVVIIDTESSFNKRNMALFESCDIFVLVVLQDVMSAHKLKCFMNEVEKMMPDSSNMLYSKTIALLNKYSNTDMGNNFEVLLSGRTPVIKIPYLTDIFISDGTEATLNRESKINTYLAPLVSEISVWPNRKGSGDSRVWN